MPRELWDEITYPFPNFNGATVEVWEVWSDNDFNFHLSLVQHQTHYL